MILSSSGCQPKARVPSGAPPAPSGPTVERRPTSFPASRPLQRLADAGAWIYPSVASNWDGLGTSIVFKNQELGRDALSALQHVEGTVFVTFAGCRFRAGAFKALDKMGNLNSLDIGDGAGDDALLGEVKSLPGLERLVVGSPQVSARGLRFLNESPQLRVLGLGERGIDDNALTLVGKCRNLIELQLWSTSITDNGLRHLANLKKLLSLAVGDCGIADAGLRHLGALTELRSLGIGGTGVTDGGLAELASLRRLEFLGLPRTNISGAGLKSLASLTSLHELNLENAKITDDGVDGIAALKQLHAVYLRDTDVSDKGLAKLASLPKLQLINAAGTRATPEIRALFPKVTVWLDDSAGADKPGR